MQAYSMDLRERALLDSDAGMKAADVAVKYRVSGSWVRLLKQRRAGDGRSRAARPARAKSLATASFALVKRTSIRSRRTETRPQRVSTDETVNVARPSSAGRTNQ